MAEKEERIWIGTTEKKIQLKQMTRQEAIEKMAKALDEASLNRNKDYIFHFGLLAEATLDALLKGE